MISRLLMAQITTSERILLLRSLERVQSCYGPQSFRGNLRRETHIRNLTAGVPSPGSVRFKVYLFLAASCGFAGTGWCQLFNFKTHFWPCQLASSRTNASHLFFSRSCASLLSSPSFKLSSPSLRPTRDSWNSFTAKAYVLFIFFFVHTRLKIGIFPFKLLPVALVLL